jgi:plastocyanin
VRRPAAIAAALAALLVAGCGGGGSSGSSKQAASAPKGAIETYDFGFRPPTSTVRAGTNVRWVNTGQQIHTIKQLPGSREKFFSRALDAGQAYSHRFSRPGSYPYFCTLHPQQMRGTIVVR